MITLTLITNLQECMKKCTILSDIASKLFRKFSF